MQQLPCGRNMESDKLSKEALSRISTHGSLHARQALARYLIREDRPEETKAVIDRLPAAVSGGLQARLLLIEGNQSDAVRRARFVIARDVTNCDALIAASEGSLSSGRADEALRQAQIATAECPDITGGWIASTRAYQKLGRGSGVQRVFVEALDRNKQSSELTQMYTRWLLSEGRPREAVAMARRLTGYAPALLSGWQHYLDLCHKYDSRCIAEGEQGLKNARTLLGIDLPPGTPPPNGLFGRLVAR